MGTDRIKSRDNWCFGSKEPLIKDKGRLADMYIRYMLARTQRMFEYEGLPETIPARELELILQTCRLAIFTKDNDKLYVFYGGLGGLPNEYFQPTKAIVINPFLKFNEILDINQYDKDNAVVMWNDSLHIGLMPLNELNAYLLAETDISIRFALINSRIPAFMKAENDSQKESMETLLENIEEGKKLGVLGGKSLLEGFQSFDYTNKSSSNIKDLIEMKQYIYASWLNSLGIQSNFNMKRESLNSTESGLNEDSLMPLCDDMLEQRKLAVKRINEMFGTNISVDFSSSWKKMRVEQKEIVENETPTNDKNEESEVNNENETEGNN